MHKILTYHPGRQHEGKVGVLQLHVAAASFVLESNDACGATAPFFSPQRLSVNMDEC
jgi:hypothetical protein